MYVQVKKDTKYFNEKLINQLPVRMPRLNMGGGGGGKGFFPQQKIKVQVREIV